MRFFTIRRTAWIGMCCLPIALLSACTFDDPKRPLQDLGVDPREAEFAKSAAFRDTIGSRTYYDGMRSMAVQGLGVVVGLGDRGSQNCPENVFNKLVQELHKRHDFATARVGIDSLKPEELIRDIDTAVVVVNGEIPAGAIAGTRFDVVVTALPGTDTRSLEGGRLYTTELEIIGQDGVRGRSLASASGPIFQNPFIEDGGIPLVDPRRGRILGGGEANADRRVRLVLTSPSHAMARRVQDRINAKYATDEKVADAVSPAYINISVPEKYHDDVGHFLELIRHLYLTSDPNFEAIRAMELAQELTDPQAPHADIALCFEALGRSAIPVLDELYTDERDYVSFFAGVAGLRLSEHLAADVVVMHAEDPDSTHRLAAIRALGYAQRMAGPAKALRRLVDSDDRRVRIAAYQSLVELGDPFVHTMVIGGDNFTLDLVPSDREPFIHVRRTEERRIALFGSGLRCEPPLLYRAPDGSVLIQAAPGDSRVTLVRTVPHSGNSSPPIEAPLGLVELIRLMGSDAEVNRDQVLGLGLHYGAVLRALYQLSQSGQINADFELEQPRYDEVFMPQQPEGRPETEL